MEPVNRHSARQAYPKSVTDWMLCDPFRFLGTLILIVLGVPREAIMHDYLLSHTYFFRDREMARLLTKYSKRTGIQVNQQVLGPLLEARPRPEYLESALNHIQTEYGGHEDYLQEKLGLDQAGLADFRDRFTPRQVIFCSDFTQGLTAAIRPTESVVQDCPCRH